MKKVILIAAIALWCVSALAQQPPTLSVLIEDFNRHSTICGLDENALKSIATVALRNSGIQVVRESNPLLYVKVSTVSTSPRQDICISHTTVAVRLYGPTLDLKFKRRTGGVMVNFCDYGGLDATTFTNHEKGLRERIELGIKVCLGELDY